MVIILGIFTFMSLIVSLFFFVVAQSAVHEAVAGLFLLNASVLLVGACIVAAVRNQRNEEHASD